ncbi:EcsC family protein [Acinetobacter wanghuae]|uniref:EcsC family protein n=1 Tax=Acinetobacter wanghuae TaxID=2662362 RepID=A0A5Q0P101_9GAMM|nr:EcsC family protein [Acinetobacter wanghuae]MQW93225.1 EcsC family protein [Acinetobacter wanghuae]QGA10434.1 EcsC family protein [Acinetobacter wanghuae]
MANTNNKQSKGLISGAFGVAKKFSTTGLDLLSHVAPDSVSKINSALNVNEAIEGAAQTKTPFSAKQYNDPQQMLKEHLPSVTRQLLGRHYNKVNNVAHFVSPQLSDKISDYFFDHLNQFSNDMSSVDAVLDEAGVRDLEELTKDVDRSQRIAQALGEQNKWIASIQGAVSGATGLVGTAVDIPASLILALRTIYQVGRSYGFDLTKQEDQDIVQHIFKQIDLGLIAEKQALILGLKALSNTVKTHDISQLQSLLGSSNDAELLKKFFGREDLQEKWQWLNSIPKISILEQLTKLTPIASAGVGVVYSRRFVEDVNAKAQEIFSNARQYVLQHGDDGISILAAYEKSISLLKQAAPQLLETSEKASDQSAPNETHELILDQDIPMAGNSNMSQVKLVKKSVAEVNENTDADVEKEKSVGKGLDALAEKLVEPVADKQTQQPALSASTASESFDLEDEAEIQNEQELTDSEAQADTENDLDGSSSKKSLNKQDQDVTKDK